ncbi:uncharacterized protein LOC143300261 [Babylonia areolata]|uniref:uncharacterized protein LOC143300261 n=1 Tax=Babylonia areolata TaxID=304850 RepID=UPI003FCF9E7B
MTSSFRTHVDLPNPGGLHYHLARTTAFIRLNGHNGVLTLSRALQPRDIGRHRVTVVVTDSGEPRKASNASFDLVVFAANATGDGGGPGERVEHLLIVIILGSVTGIITVAVIVTIVVIRRADQQRRKYREREDVKVGVGGQKAAVEMGSALIVCSPSPTPAPVFGKHHQGGGSSSPSPKDCTFEEDSFPDKSFSGGSVSQESQRSGNGGGGEDGGGGGGGPGQWNKALRLHQDLLKLHGVDPGFLLQPDDGNSDASGESTTCDSGRGGSEEDSHSTGRMSPSVQHSDGRGGAGNKMPRHLSTFHPGGVSRTLRSNPSTLRQDGTVPGHHHHHYSPTPTNNTTNTTLAPASSYTENGQPVKKVSFQDDPARKQTASPPISSNSSQQRGGHGVDRWQSPLLIGGGDGGTPPPAPPPTTTTSSTSSFSSFSSPTSSSSSSQPLQYPSLNRHQYVNVGKGRHLYGGLSPRLDLDASLDTVDDNTSTTTSGSYQVELESFPPSGPRHSLDHNSLDFSRFS